MAVDILKFLVLYLLVLFAFGCGMNQLLWYYADLEYDKCYSLPGGLPNVEGEVTRHNMKVVWQFNTLHAQNHWKFWNSLKSELNFLNFFKEIFEIFSAWQQQTCLAKML